MGAGSTNLKEIIMANIGTFTKTGNEYKGEIVTMSVQQKNVRIVPEDSDNENAPSHRVFVGRAEIGAAWTKTSNEGRDYLSVKLDDPSFTAPIFANLFDDEDGKSYNLIWSRRAVRTDPSRRLGGQRQHRQHDDLRLRWRPGRECLALRPDRRYQPD